MFNFITLTTDRVGPVVLYKNRLAQSRYSGLDVVQNSYHNSRNYTVITRAVLQLKIFVINGSFWIDLAKFVFSSLKVNRPFKSSFCLFCSSCFSDDLLSLHLFILSFGMITLKIK